MNLSITMAKIFLKIFSRDRQAIFFSLFFPLVLMTVIGLASGGGDDPTPVGIVNYANNDLAENFIQSLATNPFFEVLEGEESTLREDVINGDLTLLLILPENFQNNGSPADIALLVDASQVRQLGALMPIVEQALVEVERDLRNTEPLFTIAIEDVQARSQSYLDFLVPGLLAMTIMQISLAGSGFNIVEYRRKGILKRLFVTPIEPRDFIGGLVISRTVVCLVQFTVLIAIAVFIVGVNFSGNFLALYLVMITGTAIFLSIGFCLGSIAKTQQSIMAVGNLVTFPQIFLSGIFYPIDALPALIQPIAKLLPLSYVSSAIREIAVNGQSLIQIWPDMLGMIIWMAIALFLAVRLFVWKEVAA